MKLSLSERPSGPEAAPEVPDGRGWGGEASVGSSVKLVGEEREANQATGVIAGRTSCAGSTCEAWRGGTLVCGVVRQRDLELGGGWEAWSAQQPYGSDFQTRTLRLRLSPYAGIELRVK